MTVNEVLDQARNLTGTTTDQVTNDVAIVWANIVYRKIVRKIVKEIDENYFVTTTDIDAVAGTTGYDLPAGFLKLRGARVKPTNSSPNYVPTTEIDFNQQEQTIDWFQTYQSASYPRHQIIGSKIFIAPVFTAEAIEGVTNNNMIQVDCEIRPSDLSTGGAETTILIPKDYHHVISIGIKRYIYSFLRKTNDANSSLTEFEIELSQMISEMEEQDTTKNTLKRPSETHLE